MTIKRVKSEAEIQKLIVDRLMELLFKSSGYEVLDEETEKLIQGGDDGKGNFKS